MTSGQNPLGVRPVLRSEIATTGQGRRILCCKTLRILSTLGCLAGVVNILTRPILVCFYPPIRAG